MSYMKNLFTELQEEGMSADEICKIPSKKAWQMVAIRKAEKEKQEPKNRLRSCFDALNTRDRMRM